MSKTHYRVVGIDCRNQGQSEYEFNHQTACGYVRDDVSIDPGKVTCKLCLRSGNIPCCDSPGREKCADCQDLNFNG